MTVYGIAQLTITDRDAYDRYTPGFMPVLRRFGGTLLVADESPTVVEGDWASEKLVVASFDDEAAFRRWYDSSEYQAIVGDRLAGAHGPLLLATGVRSRP